MSPDEYKNGGEPLRINYQHTQSPFGNLMIASTSKGICSISFVDDEERALELLQNRFPKATYTNQPDVTQQQALSIFTQDGSQLAKINLHLKGTDFQLKVWEALLTVPMGQLSTYKKIATQIHHPKAYRAVGTAVGDNPIAFLIPCHRIIQSSGAFGNYHWGSTIKTAIIDWEAARMER